MRSRGMMNPLEVATDGGDTHSFQGSGAEHDTPKKAPTLWIVRQAVKWAHSRMERRKKEGASIEKEGGHKSHKTKVSLACEPAKREP